jgi:hypothetical protein
MMILHAFLIASTGIVLRVASTANHTRHLASFWGFMAGASGASLLLGLCSARKHGKWIQFGRVALLASFLVQVTVGIALLSLADHACT